MTKTVTATNQVEARYASDERKESGRVLFLVLKNVLFWGSIALTCYALYTGAAYLVG